MRIKVTHLVIGIAAVSMVLACSSKKPQSRTAMLLENQSGDVDMYEEVTGIDDTTPVATEEEERSEVASDLQETESKQSENYIGGSQGAFLGKIILDGEETKGSFTVKAATNEGEVIKENVPAGSEVRLDPGKYDFVFQSNAVVGSPEFTLRDVEIPAGQRIVRDVKMPVGKITLVTGGRCASKPIKIRIQGATEWIKGKFRTCNQLTLLAGTYEAEMGSGRNSTSISGIQVYDGGIRDVLIRPQ